MSRAALRAQGWAIAATAALLLSLLGACARTEPALETGASFATPDEAASALVAAIESDDIAKIGEVLGPETVSLVRTDDAAADRAAAEAFVARYRTRHQWASGGPDDLVLLVGEDDWPLPFPLVKEEGGWRFDSVDGALELLSRRIGTNELRTIDVMRGVVAAQEDYAAEGRDGAPAGIYAQRLRSTPGKHDGLYWEAVQGGPESPAGPMLADAAVDALGDRQGERNPYHGYLFRLLTSQGAQANGGALDYVVDGKLSRGFAVLAYPAEYGLTGVTTFIVNHEGVVWQRDLGEKTSELAVAIQQFDPDESWTPLAPEEMLADGDTAPAG